MQKKIDLSIIIVSFNTRDLLKQCLDSLFVSLKESHLRFEVIIVDNNSNDGSCVMVREKYPQVRLIENKRNFGFGKGNNQGAKLAKAEVILFLNSDIVVLEKAIEKLYVYFKSLPYNSIVGGKLFNEDRTPQPSCGPAYTLGYIFIAQFLKGDYLSITRYSPRSIKEVDWVMGACMMFSRSDFIDLGGFDEGIFMYMEEIDLEYRAKNKGIKILFYPLAEFIHTGAGSSQGQASPILNVFRGFMYFYKKHMNTWQLYLLRVILLFKAVSAIILFTILGNKSRRQIYFSALKLLK